MEKPISLDGVKMRVVSTAEGGEVGAGTVFEFAQDGPVVSARYAGGKVYLGYLVGVLSAEGLSFRYAQVGADGRLDGGYSTCEIGLTGEGKLRLIEHFNWDSRDGSGATSLRR